MPALIDIAGYLDHYLKIEEASDWPGAVNGLQVENGGTVRKIGAAVDACEAALQLAVERKIDLLVVHHGLFWNGVQPVRGPLYRKLKLALDHGLAVYSAHLPLDFHPAVGNNALLCRALGFKKTAPFLLINQQYAGLKTQAAVSRQELHRRLEKVLGGPVKLCPGGPEKVSRIGVVTGSAGSEVLKAAAEGIDTFITGEGPHWSYPAAEELGINLFYGGHYATETFGVKALAAHLSKRFQVPWEFLDHPTGL